MVALGSTSADPTGTYTATIGQPGGSRLLTGSVTVTRVDESYRVVWDLDGAMTTGIALGGAFNRGDLVVGPAHADDVMLVVGYRDGEGYGSATLIMQIDGSYQGYRVSSESGKAVPERWVPAR
jgi:hypothetical protein